MINRLSPDAIAARSTISASPALDVVRAATTSGSGSPITGASSSASRSIGAPPGRIVTNRHFELASAR